MLCIQGVGRVCVCSLFALVVVGHKHTLVQPHHCLFLRFPLASFWGCFFCRALLASPTRPQPPHTANPPLEEPGPAPDPTETAPIATTKHVTRPLTTHMVHDRYQLPRNRNHTVCLTESST